MVSSDAVKLSSHAQPATAICIIKRAPFHAVHFTCIALDRDIEHCSGNLDRATWVNASMAAVYKQNPRNPLRYRYIDQVSNDDSDDSDGPGSQKHDGFGLTHTTK